MQDETETLDYSVNWVTWLGTDTISSVTNTVTGLSISNASNTTTTATFRLSGSISGWLEHRITTAGGRTKELLILLEVSGYPIRDDYGLKIRA
jgi:carbohydrate-binding DOMON domain-containing protein